MRDRATGCAPPEPAVRREHARRGRVLAELLESSGEIRARLGAIRVAVEAGGERQVDVLGSLVDLLPVDVFEDPRCALEVIDRVLAEVGELAAGGPTWAELERQLRNVVFRVCSDYFKARAPAGACAESPYPQLESSDDPRALVAELAALPDAERPLVLDERALAAERLAALLHLVAVHEDPPLGVTERLVADLRRADPGAHRLLRYCLERLLCETGRRRAGLRRLAAALHEAGLTGIASENAGLTAEIAAAVFPAAFGLFIDGLDDGALGEIARVCELVGSERIRAATPELTAPDGILAPPRSARILAVRARQALPLLRILAAKGDARQRAAVVDSLCGLELGSPQAAAIGVVPAQRLPVDYVCGVCDVEGGNGWTEIVRHQSCALLRGVIEDRSEALERRVLAVRRLEAFPRAEVESMLQELLAARGPLGLSRLPRALREAASGVLQRLAGGATP
jgi:hypothetical protein